ncbi:DUF58 domain-containing protein [Amnibacterium endophyticum]|uniref:DUF58 domain-containing protein n=1 Tax=Amnibacterium endophyticum TaxID=2109337 RepID=A0ABW4LI13_9MICO
MTVARFRGLDLVVRRRLDGLLHGEHAGLRLGAGGDAEELTRYRPGHDVRRIDWNVTARSTEPMVWRTRAEHELDTWVLVDRTASMAFGTVAHEKSETAEWLAGAIGLLTDAPGNRVGIGSLEADGVRWLRPLAGRAAAHRALTADPPAREGVASTSLADAIGALERRYRRPGLRVVVSDLLEPDGAHRRPFPWEQPLKRLARRHDVVVAEVIDPRELELPPVGEVVLTDPETGAQREVSTSDRRVRDAYAAAAREHRAATAEAVRAAGAAHLPLTTHADWTAELARFVIRRRRTPARRPRSAAR